MRKNSTTTKNLITKTIYTDAAGHLHNLDIVRKFPRNKHQRAVTESRVVFQIIRPGRIEYLMAACEANCQSYDLPIENALCSPLHFFRQMPNSSLAVVSAKCAVRDAFKVVTLFDSDSSANNSCCVIFADLSFRMLLVRAGRWRGYTGNVFDLKYSNNLSKRPPNHPASQIGAFIKKKLYLEDFLYMARRQTKKMPGR